MELVKNQLLTLEITDTTIEGYGVGRTDSGQVIFVPAATGGDLVRVRIVKVQKNHAYGKTEELFRPSVKRATPRCPVFQQCGGCAFWHLDYETEKDIKTRHVAQTLRRIGGIDIDVPPVLGSEKVSGYRNKAQLPVGRSASGGLDIGFYSSRSHRIVNVENCLIQNELATKTVKVVREWMTRFNVTPYDEESHSGMVRHIFTRFGEKTGQLMVVLITNVRALPYSEELVDALRESIPQVTGVVQNINKKRTNVVMGDKNVLIWGLETIIDEIDGLSFSLSPHSFYQINRDQTERLYALALEFAELEGHETVLDLYCGIGTISLYFARFCKKVYGVEVVPQAVADAKENARRNGASNAEFFCADASQALALFEKKGIRPEVVVVDPPRKGCDRALLEIIAQISPERLIYISCNPATLARDLKILAEKGYSVRRIQPVDMFPRTGHVETVVLMSRVDK